MVAGKHRACIGFRYRLFEYILHKPDHECGEQVMYRATSWLRASAA